MAYSGQCHCFGPSCTVTRVTSEASETIERLTAVMAVCGTPTIRTVRCIVTEYLDFASALSVHADSVHAMVSRGESHDKLVSNAFLLLAP